MVLAIDSNGWLNVAAKPSPNYSDRSPGAEISLLVIHNISLPAGCFEGEAIFALFQNTLDCSQVCYQHLQGLTVSAHFVIRRDGDLFQCVALAKRAWHAGVSEFEGVANCNDYSIGIELEGTDHQAYTDAQYASLIALTDCLQKAYPAISIDRIVGHQHIAPTRKTDPGPAFDWRRYKSALTDQASSSSSSPS